METFYFGNAKVCIERIDEYEYKVIIEGVTAFWLSKETKEQFIKDMNEVEHKHRI